MFFPFQRDTDDQESAGDRPFDLGNGIYAQSPDEAMDKFLEREFPDVLNISDGESHEVIFIPDSYIYKDLTEKVILRQNL